MGAGTGGGGSFSTGRIKLCRCAVRDSEPDARPCANGCEPRLGPEVDDGLTPSEPDDSGSPFSSIISSLSSNRRLVEIGARGLGAMGDEVGLVRRPLRSMSSSSDRSPFEPRVMELRICGPKPNDSALKRIRSAKTKEKTRRSTHRMIVAYVFICLIHSYRASLHVARQ